MTVRQSPLSPHNKQDQDKFKEYINKLRDVTGIPDDDALRGALVKTSEENGNINLEKAVEYLMERPNQEPKRQPDGAESMTASPAAVTTTTATANPQPQNGVVDLTQDYQVQKALELSMEEHRSSTSSTSGTNTRPPGVTQEDQDVSKALEASLMESNKRRRSQDTGNPEDRKRANGWPVGLKNVGQTCWFSAVIQSFFNLPAFRILVLNFKPPQREPSDNKERKILDFMLELRKLFSLLVGSHKKYVDPSCAVDILRGCLGGGGAQNHSNNQQQDVSEFTHRLLDWLEEAFKIRDKYNRPVSALPSGEGLQGDGGPSCKEQQAMDIEVEKCDKEKEVVKEEEGEGRGRHKEEEGVGGGGGSTGNPMFDLFYGRVRIEGKNQGNIFNREEQFGQLPLQVNNFSNIHDSLEACTAHEYIDASSQSDLQNVPQQLAVRKSGQERWFMKLPPVLFFELSRFQYNQEKRMAEKVNDFLDFPEVIYMDRYMESNKLSTRTKREEVKKLKEEKEMLNRELQSYLQYGNQSSSHKIPLVSILSGTLQFARSGMAAGSAVAASAAAAAACDDVAAQEVEGRSPAPSSHSMQVDSPCSSPVSLTPASSTTNLATTTASTTQAQSLAAAITAATAPQQLKTLPDGSVQIPIRIERATPPPTDKQLDQPTPMEVESDESYTAPEADVAPKPLTGGGVGGGRGDGLVIMPQVPAPKHITEVELKVLSSCLTRWRKEIEEELSTLRAALDKVEERIATMYTKPELRSHEYRLHAVMVHEGDVNQGHYWAYVYDLERKVWLKFNDNTVTESSYEAMKTESVGGRLSTSAYSMIYIDTSRPDLFEDDAVAANAVPFGGGMKSTAANGSTLPEDLEQYVLGDNKAFAAEILAWQEQQLEKKHELEMSEAGKVLIGDDPEVQIIETKNDLKRSHAQLAEGIVIKILRDNVSKCITEAPKSLGEVKNDICALVQKRCQQTDEGLDNFLSYLICVGCEKEVVGRALAEHIDQPFQDIANSNAGRQWLKEAREELRVGGAVAKETHRLHWAYHNYRIAAHYFVLGVERYNDGKYEEAVDLLTTAYIVNDKLANDNKHSCQKNLGMPTRGLMKYFHIAVESLNSDLVQQFQSKPNPREVAQSVSKVLVPAIHLLQHRTNNKCDPGNRDAELLETVRGRWCALLETPMPADKHEHWSTVFNKVVPDDNSVIMNQPTDLRYPSEAEDLQLANKFRNIMQAVLKEDS